MVDIALNLTNTCIGQISVFTFCAKPRTKAANKNFLAEMGVIRRKVNLKIAWEVELNSAVFPLVRIFHFLFKPRDYKERIKHCLIFDKKNLSYHKGNATIWEIEYMRLGYLELPKDLSPRSLLENSYEVFVHTNDNDKYAFDSTLSPDKINELKSEIEQRAGSV